MTLKDGRVLVAGGGDEQTAEIFNPSTKAFSQVASMHDPRSGAAGALLPDGRVLVAGGYNGSTYLQTAEIYNPTTNSWSPTASMGINRNGAAGAPLPDGRALVVGGTSLSAPLASAETFNPASSIFSNVGGMGTAASAPPWHPFRMGGYSSRAVRTSGARWRAPSSSTLRPIRSVPPGSAPCQGPAMTRPQRRCPRDKC